MFRYQRVEGTNCDTCVSDGSTAMNGVGTVSPPTSCSLFTKCGWLENHDIYLYIYNYVYIYVDIDEKH